MTIKPYPQNAKKHPKKQLEQIAASIERFGFRQPIVIDRDGTIIVGHGRYEAATKILEWTELKEAPEAKKGEKVIPYIIADDLTEDEIKAYRLTDNKLNESGWDMDIVDLELKGLDDELIKLTGFELDNLETHEDDFNVESVSKNIHGVELGDIYGLGEHRLMCGDSTQTETVERLMDGQKADMVFTDPPYNVDYKGTAGSIINDKFSTNAHFYQFLYDSIGAMRPFVLGSVYICMSSSELHTLQKAFTDNGGHWSTFIIWVKNTFTLGRSDYQRQYEPILYGWFEKSSHYWSGSRKLGDVLKLGDDLLVKTFTIDEIELDVWEVAKPSHNKQHPTMKPIELCERAINHSSALGDIVLDSFGGSGSTLMACEQLKRKCYTMELDPHYCSVIIERWQQFTNKKAIKLS